MKLKSLICIIEKIFATVHYSYIYIINLLVWHEYICTLLLLYVQQGSPLHDPKEPLSIIAKISKIKNLQSI